MTVEDFNPQGPISVRQWDAATRDLRRRTEGGELVWARLQVSESIEPVYQAQTGDRRVQLAAWPTATPTDFLMGSVWGGMAEGASILKVYDADRRLIITSPALEALDGLKNVIEAQIRRSREGPSGG